MYGGPTTREVVSGNHSIFQLKASGGIEACCKSLGVISDGLHFADG